MLLSDFQPWFICSKSRFWATDFKSWGQETGNADAGREQTDLADMKDLLETGKVVPVIDRRYAFNEIPEAMRYLEEGHARGKVVIHYG